MDQQTSAAPRFRGKPVEILPGLWLGSLASLQAINQDEKEWTVISILGSDKLISLANSFLEQKKAKGQCTEHILWKISDKNDSMILCDTLKSILSSVDKVLSNGGNCLVHCAMGVSRSVTVCACWIMSREKLTLEHAMEKIRKVRPEALPNLGFTASLRALEQVEGDIDKAIDRFESRRVESGC